MKIVRFQTSQGEIKYGANTGEGIVEIDGCIYGDYTVSTRPADVAKLLAPVNATQIIGVGLNYRQHAVETGAKVPEYPVVFFKNVAATTGPGSAIEIPTKLASDKVDYECELALVIGKDCKNVSRENALEYVLGYTCANDISARDWQIDRSGTQWSRGKSFDTFCPLGPCLVTADEIPNPNTLNLRTILNGEVMQDSNTRDMIFDVPTLIEFLSGSTTLPAGTVILTGTPPGVGMAQKPPRWLVAGDEVVIEIEGIGSLNNNVVNEA